MPARLCWMKPLGGILPLLTLCLSDTVRAETSANFQVSAVIEAGCSVDGLGLAGNAGTIGALDFGEDSGLSTATHTAGLIGNQVITLRCTPGVTLTMAIDGGQHEAGGIRNLQLGGGTEDRLQYRLYADAGFNQEIDIGQSRSITITSAVMNDVELPVFGRLVLPGARVPGVYTDTLIVTLDW